MVDLNLLEPGEDYRDLKDTYVIMITPFDLFGKGRYKYTFRMICEEVPEMALGDGATRIFLNTRGTDSESASEELIALLHYFEETTGESAAESRLLLPQERQQRQGVQYRQPDRMGHRIHIIPYPDEHRHAGGQHPAGHDHHHCTLPAGSKN